MAEIAVELALAGVGKVVTVEALENVKVNKQNLPVLLENPCR